jgi:hypothetical protein
VTPPRTWNLSDLLDFEYLISEDDGVEESCLVARDQSIAAAATEPHAHHPTSLGDRHRIFQHWLDSRRSSTGSLPGAWFSSGCRVLLLSAAVTGLFLGVGLTRVLLKRHGYEPVNVALFFAATVGVQWVLLAWLILWRLLRYKLFPLNGFQLWHQILTSLPFLLNTHLRSLPGEHRERLRVILAIFQNRRDLYGSLATFPLLILNQCFGVCFNIGVLATLLIHVTFSDLAFGWQSTLITSPEKFFHGVSVMALPWLALPNAHPTLEQVQNSQFTFSTGLPLPSAAAEAVKYAWWPFLCYSIAFYGLLVRALLLKWGLAGLHKALQALPLDHPRCNALLRRLARPLVRTSPAAVPSFARGAVPDTTEGGTPLLTSDSDNGAEFAGANLVSQRTVRSDPSVPPGEVPDTPAGCFLMVSSELDIGTGFVEPFLHERFDWRVCQTINVEIDYPTGNACALTELASRTPRPTGIVVAISANRSPIKAVAVFLNKLIASSGGCEIIVLLFGTHDGGIYSPVDPESFENWRRFNLTHGLHLGLEKWSA